MSAELVVEQELSVVEQLDIVRRNLGWECICGVGIEVGGRGKAMSSAGTWERAGDGGEGTKTTEGVIGDAMELPSVGAEERAGLVSSGSRATGGGIGVRSVDSCGTELFLSIERRSGLSGSSLRAVWRTVVPSGRRAWYRTMSSVETISFGVLLIVVRAMGTVFLLSIRSSTTTTGSSSYAPMKPVCPSLPDRPSTSETEETGPYSSLKGKMKLRVVRMLCMFRSETCGAREEASTSSHVLRPVLVDKRGVEAA